MKYQLKENSGDVVAQIKKIISERCITIPPKSEAIESVTLSLEFTNDQVSKLRHLCEGAAILMTTFDELCKIDSTLGELLRASCVPVDSSKATTSPFRKSPLRAASPIPLTYSPSFDALPRSSSDDTLSDTNPSSPPSPYAKPMF